VSLFGENLALALTVEGMALRGLVFADRSVESWFNIPLSPDSVKGGLISAPEKVGKVMAEAIRERGLPRKGVLAALPSSGSVAETLTLARTKKGKLDELVKREVKRLAIASPDSNYLYWQLLSAEGDKQQVSVLTTPKENVRNLVAACRAAGITLKDIDLKPFALTRAVKCKDGIIVHGEMDCIEIVIVNNFSTSVFRGIPLEAAAPGWDTAISQLLRELPITIDYYNHTHHDSPISPDIAIYLTGELALDSALRQRVAEAAKRPVGSIEPPVDCPKNFPMVQYMTSIGLMLKSKV